MLSFLLLAQNKDVQNVFRLLDDSSPPRVIELNAESSELRDMWILAVQVV